METTGAEILIRSLEREGTEIIFGYPGAAVMEIYDCLYDSRITHILTRTEQGAAHAANGFARVSGKTGVCMATSGPGATNLVTGIATAYMDSVPMVFITGQVPKPLVGTDAFQEVDITGITAPITKYSFFVQDAGELSRVVAEAFHIASAGRPGPVLIDLPRDVLQQKAPYKPWEEVDVRSYKPTVKGHPAMIKKAAGMIAQAERPVIIAGGGVISAGACFELEKLALVSGASVVTTLMGVGAFPENSPLYKGMLGTYGVPLANAAVQDSDCIVALGTRFSNRTTGNRSEFAPDATVVHVDIDPAEIGKCIDVDIPVVGDLRSVLAGLLARLGDTEKKFPEGEDPVPECSDDSPAPEKIMKDIRRTVPYGCPVTTDVGCHQMWAARHIGFRSPRTFISSGGLGTMGYGFPAAVGAQFAAPDSKVVCITGDGSIQMCMTEMAVAAEYNLPVKTVLLKNNSLGMVRQLQKHYFRGRYSQVDFRSSVNFAALARAWGFEAYEVQDPDSFGKVFAEAYASDRPALVVVEIDRDEGVYPLVLSMDSLSDMTCRKG